MRPGAGVAHDNECSEMRTFLVVLAAAALGASCISAAALAEGRYHSLLFRPAFSVALKSGWTVAERDAGAAQIYKICASCEHGGEERGELTLGHGAFRLAAEVRHQRARRPAESDRVSRGAPRA